MKLISVKPRLFEIMVAVGLINSQRVCQWPWDNICTFWGAIRSHILKCGINSCRVFVCVCFIYLCFLHCTHLLCMWTLGVIWNSETQISICQGEIQLIQVCLPPPTTTIPTARLRFCAFTTEWQRRYKHRRVFCRVSGCKLWLLACVVDKCECADVLHAFGPLPSPSSWCMWSC